MRYSENARRSSGTAVSTVAESTEPTMEPMPPSTTITRISIDFMNPKLEGFRMPR